MRKALTYITLLLCSAVLYAQEDTTFVPDGKVIPMNGAFLVPLQERDSVLIADQLLYGFELKGVREGTQIALPELPKERDYKLMYLTPWAVDTLKVEKTRKGEPGLLDLRGSVVISSFEEGIYELPQIAVQRMTSDGVIDTLVFDPVRLEVKTMPVDTATFVPHDIKGQMRYPVTFREILPWLGLAFAAAALVYLIVYLILRYRRRSDPAYQRRDPAHIVALRKLDQYRGNKLWAPEKQKIFYSGVTDTLREYIAERYGIGAMEMTTAELFNDLKDSDVPKELAAELRELFERADFVKFAKYTASDEDNASVLPMAVKFVTSTYQADIQESAGETSKEGGE